MIVRELIEELQKFPADLPVEVGCVDSQSEEFELESNREGPYSEKPDRRYLLIHHI